MIARESKNEGEGEWNAKKWVGSERRSWLKIHLGIGEGTLERRTIEVFSNNIGNAPMLAELLNKTPPDQDIG